MGVIEEDVVSSTNQGKQCCLVDTGSRRAPVTATFSSNLAISLISEKSNEGGQGYCQGGFSADFTKVMCQACPCHEYVCVFHEAGLRKNS